VIKSGENREDFRQIFSLSAFHSHHRHKGMKKTLPYLPLLLLALLALLAYGLLLPFQGFYWDDLPMSWIRYQLGPAAMMRYFANNRPVWGLLYQITTRIFPHVPIYWQVFALFWRWVGAVLVWAIVRQIWPQRKTFAVGVSALFLLYTGFNQQWVAYLYSHFFIVLAFFLLSFFCMLLALQRKSALLTAAALIFSALNLWMMEYFFVLEMARPAVIWLALRRDFPTPRQRLRPGLRIWLPYLAVFLLAVLSRLFIFNNQVYGFGLLPKLKAEPLVTSLSLLQNILLSLWTVVPAAWAQVFHLPQSSVYGWRTLLVYGAVTLIAFGLMMLFFWREQAAGPERSAGETAREAIALGLWMLPLACAPFWLIDLPVTLGFPANRFTLPAMLAASLILAGLLEGVPIRWRSALLASLVALAVGRQFLWATDFRRDWEAQKNLFWQMTWRAPALAPQTVVLLNERLAFYADNSLGAALNWIYAPQNHSDQIAYLLFYPTNRLGASLPDLQPGLPIQYDYLAGRFQGNTSQAVAFYYDPPACLRLLEPDFDPVNRLIPEESLMRQAARLSSPRPILSEPLAQMPAVYGPEPAHGWCYYFEKADLARQEGDWQQVVALGKVAFSLDDYPNDPVERFVFIEGYAHVGEWQRALELSQVSYRVSKEVVGPLLCRLWQRLEAETASSAERAEVLSQVRMKFGCETGH